MIFGEKQPVERISISRAMIAKAMLNKRLRATAWNLSQYSIYTSIFALRALVHDD
jgi:hypothetical protein